MSNTTPWEQDLMAQLRAEEKSRKMYRLATITLAFALIVSWVVINKLAMMI